MKFQCRLSNGKWADESRVDYFVAKAIERDAYFAEREQRPQMTASDVFAALAAGKALPYDTDWYAEIRDGDTVKPRPTAQPKQTLCDCGHYSAHPMTTSRGTSCPDCYDRMSG